MSDAGFKEMEQSRWELSALFGPCTEREAADMLSELADLTNQRFGLVWAAQKVEDE